jgi:anti-sigma B factor antagonist
MTADRLLERKRDPLLSRALRAPPLRGTSEASPAGIVEEPAGTPVSGLSIACKELEDLVVVGLVGELDVYTTPAFREEVRRYDPAEVQLVIDLVGIRLLDSAGLGALVSLRNEAHRGGGWLGLVCPDRHLARLFWVTGLRAAFAFGENLTAVRAAVAEARRDRVGAGHPPTP